MCRVGLRGGYEWVGTRGRRGTESTCSGLLAWGWSSTERNNLSQWWVDWETFIITTTVNETNSEWLLLRYKFNFLDNIFSSWIISNIFLIHMRLFGCSVCNTNDTTVVLMGTKVPLNNSQEHLMTRWRPEDNEERIIPTTSNGSTVGVTGLWEGHLHTIVARITLCKTFKEGAATNYSQWQRETRGGGKPGVATTWNHQIQSPL